jgi:hypothetical protein
LVAAKI